MSVIAALLGSKVGRWAVTIGLAVFAIGLVLLRARQSGINYQKSLELQRKVESLNNVIKARKDISDMSRVERDEFVSGWLRDG